MSELTIKKVMIFLCCLFIFFDTHAESSNAIQTFINQWRVSNQIPAVSVAIKKPNKSIDFFLSGSSVKDGTNPLTKNDLFGVGSVIKTFISATILQLQEAHQLNLDDPLSKYFPEYPRWGKITLRQLLNMTSGIPNFTRTDIFKNLIQNQPTAYHPLSFFVDLAYQQKDLCEPGKSWYYSNTNYYLLGMLIEKVTHHKLSVELRQRFFKSLHLDHTVFSESSYPAIVNAHRVHAYFNNKDVSDENPAYYGPAGGLLMNSTDLITWAEALFQPGRILTQHSLNQLMTTQVVPLSPPKPAGSRYGLGVYSLAIPGNGIVWWYTGVIDGYSSIFMWIPSKQTIIVAQINAFQEKNFGLLMPEKIFMNTLLDMAVLCKSRVI